MIKCHPENEKILNEKLQHRLMAWTRLHNKSLYDMSKTEGEDIMMVIKAKQHRKAVIESQKLMNKIQHGSFKKARKRSGIPKDIFARLMGLPNIFDQGDQGK